MKFILSPPLDRNNKNIFTTAKYRILYYNETPEKKTRKLFAAACAVP